MSRIAPECSQGRPGTRAYPQCWKPAEWRTEPHTRRTSLQKSLKTGFQPCSKIEHSQEPIAGGIAGRSAVSAVRKPIIADIASQHELPAQRHSRNRPPPILRNGTNEKWRFEAHYLRLPFATLSCDKNVALDMARESKGLRAKTPPRVIPY